MSRQFLQSQTSNAREHDVNTEFQTVIRGWRNLTKCIKHGNNNNNANNAIKIIQIILYIIILIIVKNYIHQFYINKNNVKCKSFLAVGKIYFVIE